MSYNTPDPSGGPHTVAHATVVLIDPVTGAAVPPGAGGGLTDAQLRAAAVPVSVAPGASRAQATVTRAANVTPYTAGDVVGGVITFPAIGLAGAHTMLTSGSLRIDISAIPAGMDGFRLYIYSATPPSALADNAAWDLPSGDRTAFIGYIDLGSPADLGSTLFVQVDAINRQIKLGAAETALYGYLVTSAGFTPAANSEVYVPTLYAVAL